MPDHDLANALFMDLHVTTGSAPIVPPIEMTEPRLTAEQRRVLQSLSDAGPRGITEPLWAAHEFSAELLSGLVVAGLATMAGETVRVEDRAIEIVRVRITEAGRDALDKG